MREFNYDIFESQVKLIRIKSDNYDCYLDQKSYQDIILTMSTGDYATHKAIIVHVGTHRLDELKLITFDEDNQGYWFQSNFDSWFESSL